MDLETELRSLLHTRDAALPVADPVPGVHAGMARRRRRQRLQVLTAALAVVGVAALSVSLVRDPAAGPAPITPATSTPEPTAEPLVVQSFSASDVSFVGDRGWALGTATCGTQRCTAQLVTTDGGATWSARPTRGLPRTCEDRCVRAVRFADERVGYAYGDSLWITLNAGESWSRVTGQEVQALEISGDNVVRVVSTQPSCQPGCTYLVQTAPVGSLVWTTRYTSTGRGVGASLTRWGDRLTLADYANRAGGALDARTRLALSDDGGMTWTAQDDPCSPGYVEGGPETDTLTVTRGPDGASMVTCAYRGFSDQELMAFSSDGGRTYGPRSGVLPSVRRALAVTGPDTAVAALLSRDGVDLQRTTDGGRTWTVVLSTQADQDEYGTMPFTTRDDGSWIPGGGRSVWRTHDGGLTWTETAFP